MQRTMTFPAVLITVLLACWAATPAAAQGAAAAVTEVYTQSFYDGIEVTVEAHTDDTFTAFVTVAEDGAHPVRAWYHLDVQEQTGDWQLPDALAAGRSFDYSEMTRTTSLDATEILSQHTPESVALSALLLWEEHLLEQRLVENGMLVTPAPGAPPLGWRQQTVEVCDGCDADTNRCSPGWIVPQSCAGSSVVGACNAHDECYQCGAFCFGSARAECDAEFRNDVQAATGSSLCATIYWIGVRLLGWLFYQDPNLRPNMGPDVYSVGHATSACEGQYAHMCTIYVM